jgi:hypothetical protein
MTSVAGSAAPVSARRSAPASRAGQLCGSRLVSPGSPSEQPARARSIAVCVPQHVEIESTIRCPAAAPMGRATSARVVTSNLAARGWLIGRTAHAEYSWGFEEAAR